MQIDLDGRSALFAGERNAFAGAAAMALTANGAMVTWAEDEAAGSDLLILSHPLDLRADVTPDRLLRLASATARRMGVTGSGRILHLMSAAGLVPMRRHGEASVAMAAIAAAVRALAMQAAPHVLVNAVALGRIDGDEPIGDAAMASHVPLGRAGTIDEAVNAVLFLCDPMNSYTTGQVLAVDGGWTTGYGRNF